MTPVERALSPGHFFDPRQTTLREWTYDRPIVAETER